LLSIASTGITFKDKSAKDFRDRDMMISVLASVRSSFFFVHGFGFLPLLWAVLIDSCGSGAQQVQELPGRPLIRAWTDRHGLNALTPPPVDPAADAAG